MLRAQEQALPPTRLGQRTAPLLLLSRSDVQRELGLTAPQIASARRTALALFDRAQSLRGQPDTPSVIAARRSIDEEQRRWVETELSPEQQARLIQIDLQWEGPAALVSRPTLAETLGLTPEQRSSLLSLLQARNKAPGPDSDRAFAQKTLALLSPDQRARWKALLGRPFVVQEAPAGDRAVQPAAAAPGQAEDRRP